MTGITNPTEEYFKDGLWGWDGSRWRKAGVPLWYRSSYFEDLGGTATGSSWSNYSSAVPSGYIYVVSAISIRNYSRAPTATEILIYNELNKCTHLEWAASLDILQPLIFTGYQILGKGWKIRVSMNGTQSGDTIVASVAGYKVAIA